MPRKSKAELSIVKPAGSAALPHGDVLSPPRPLGKAGTALWRAITNDYEISAAADTQLLGLACEALDRAEGCRARIDKVGEVIKTAAGLKDHPALKHELANRSFVVRALQRLGLDP